MFDETGDMRKASKLLAFSWNKQPNEFQKKADYFWIQLNFSFNLISAFERILFDLEIRFIWKVI